MDSMIGRLWNGLKERSLDDKINIILVGDHGIISIAQLCLNNI